MESTTAWGEPSAPPGCSGWGSLSDIAADVEVAAAVLAADTTDVLPAAQAAGSLCPATLL